jgi:MFS family permease
MIFVHKRFKYLWLSGLISTIGNYLTQIALLSIVEQRFGKKSHSGLAVSGVYLATYIPAIIATPFAGVIADIFDRRKVMFISDLLRVFIVLGFAIVFIDIQQLFWLIYVLVGLMMFCNAFFNPCREGLVPIVVPKDEILTANAVSRVLFTTNLLVGWFDVDGHIFSWCIFRWCH